MESVPKWFTALAAVALLWNLAGLAAVLGDASLNAADLASLPEAERALRSARPVWALGASVLAVVTGTLGTLALIMRRRSAVVLLALSLVCLVVQDVALLFIVGRSVPLGPAPLVIQGVVFLVAIGLLLLARKAAALNWLR